MSEHFSRAAAPRAGIDPLYLGEQVSKARPTIRASSTPAPGAAVSAAR